MLLNCLNRFEGDAIYLIDGGYVPVEIVWTANPTAPGYYFCDETRADVIGPFEHLKEAENALQEYSEAYL